MAIKQISQPALLLSFQVALTSCWPLKQTYSMFALSYIHALQFSLHYNLPTPPSRSPAWTCVYRHKQFCTHGFQAGNHVIVSLTGLWKRDRYTLMAKRSARGGLVQQKIKIWKEGEKKKEKVFIQNPSNSVFYIPVLFRQSIIHFLQNSGKASLCLFK